jgi:hypothetical protein
MLYIKRTNKLLEINGDEILLTKLLTNVRQKSSFPITESRNSLKTIMLIIEWMKFVKIDRYTNSFLKMK